MNGATRPYFVCTLKCCLPFAKDSQFCVCIKTSLNVVAMKTRTMAIMLQKRKSVQHWLHLQTVTHLLENQMWLVHLYHQCIPAW